MCSFLENSGISVSENVLILAGCHVKIINTFANVIKSCVYKLNVNVNVIFFSDF